MLQNTPATRRAIEWLLHDIDWEVKCAGVTMLSTLLYRAISRGGGAVDICTRLHCIAMLKSMVILMIDTMHDDIWRMIHMYSCDVM